MIPAHIQAEIDKGPQLIQEFEWSDLRPETPAEFATRIGLMCVEACADACDKVYGERERPRVLLMPEQAWQEAAENCESAICVLFNLPG